MDLGLVVPLGVIGGVLLLRRRPAGYLLASVLMMKVVTLLTAVWAMAILMLVRDVGGEPQAVVIIGIVDLIGIALAAWFFASAKGDQSPAAGPLPLLQKSPASSIVRPTPKKKAEKTAPSSVWI